MKWIFRALKWSVGQLVHGVSTIFGSFNAESSYFDKILFVSRSSYLQIFIHNVQKFSDTPLFLYTLVLFILYWLMIFFMCFNQTGNISTLDGASLKLVDKFTYLGSSVSSTEKDIDTRLTKAWTAIDKLSIIWKSDLTDKMKQRSCRYFCMDALLGR